jgi:hypothetical protein
MGRRVMAAMGMTVTLVVGAPAWAQVPVTDQVPPPGSHLGPGDLGQQREITQVQLQLEPPRLAGPKTDLRISDGALVGKLAGDSYNARVSSDRVSGVGPFGKIDVAITTSQSERRFDGTWNGQPLHLSVGPSGVKGHTFRMALPGSKAVQSCELMIDEPRGNTLGGQATCMGGSEPLRFSVQTPGRASLLDQDAAVLLVAFFAGPPQPPARSR